MTRSSPSASAVKRLMNCYGGSLNQYGSYSTAQISCAMPYTYGSMMATAPRILKTASWS
ncbi:dimethyl sulfoxide reductase chain YnfE [Escherichia coli]|uniref:Dimethyl sulfoxide reductase chain YnfE n=1 Tax=Escherichia coli TaxID=562 RepID=A0A377A1R0_ECOLX|nr:dimethyl sulfoxide reductase chain YnfE [Escherichia coli]